MLLDSSSCSVNTRTCVKLYLSIFHQIFSLAMLVVSLICLSVFSGCFGKNVSGMRRADTISNEPDNSITTNIPHVVSTLAASEIFVSEQLYLPVALSEENILVGSFYEDIMREMFTDSSRSSFQKFQRFGVPLQIDRLSNLTESLRSKTVEAIFVVSGELVARANDTDASTGAIVQAVAPACNHIAKEARLETNRTLAGWKYPLANLDMVCPDAVAADVELAYAVFMQSELREISATSRPSDERVQWTLNRLGDDSRDEDLRAVLEFISGISPENLRLGLEFPNAIVKRERFDRITRIVFSHSHLGVDSDFTAQNNRAIGKFIAVCILEMEPIGSVFSFDFLNVFLGHTEPVNDAFRLLREGFNSVIPLSRIKRFFDASSFGAILRGRRVSETRDFTIDFPAFPLIQIDMVNRQDLIPWANRAAGKRGIAIGHFGPPLSVVATVADMHDREVFVWPGAQIIVPRTEFQRLIQH